MYYLAKAAALFCLSRHSISSPVEALPCTKSTLFWEQPVSQLCEQLSVIPVVVTVTSTSVMPIATETLPATIEEFKSVDTYLSPADQLTVVILEEPNEPNLKSDQVHLPERRVPFMIKTGHDLKQSSRLKQWLLLFANAHYTLGFRFKQMSNTIKNSSLKEIAA